MKKNINGKMYDTAKADIIGVNPCGTTTGPVSVKNVTDTVCLYKKKNAEYFFVITCTNNYGEIGSAIMIPPLDLVKIWAINCLSDDAYIKEFGEKKNNCENWINK